MVGHALSFFDLLLTSSRYSRTLEQWFPTKPDGFLPAPALYIGLMFANFTAVFLLPYASNTPYFVGIALTARIIPFAFLLLPYVISNNLGKVHPHPHSAYSTYMTLFQTLSITSAALYLNASAVALFKNTPESSYYRHSILHPFKEEHRSTLNRGTDAINRVLGAISEHPVVTAVGLDVLLSGLTLGVWSGIRGLDAREMLGSIMPLMEPVSREIHVAASTVKESIENTVQK
jgi:hypothetical protein